MNRSDVCSFLMHARCVPLFKLRNRTFSMSNSTSPLNLNLTTQHILSIPPQLLKPKCRHPSGAAVVSSRADQRGPAQTRPTPTFALAHASDMHLPPERSPRAGLSMRRSLLVDLKMRREGLLRTCQRRQLAPFMLTTMHAAPRPRLRTFTTGTQMWTWNI